MRLSLPFGLLYGNAYLDDKVWVVYLYPTEKEARKRAFRSVQPSEPVQMCVRDERADTGLSKLYFPAVPGNALEGCDGEGI